MTARPKGPASYFPSIEKTYGRPIAEWQEVVRKHYPAAHMQLVAMLKNEHGMGHGHANAVVAHTLAQDRPQGLTARTAVRRSTAARRRSALSSL